MLTPLTTILCLSGSVRRTSPVLPLSLPATTTTGSPGARSSQRRLGAGLFLSIWCLEDLRSQTDDLHEVTLAQLAGNGPEDARASWVVGLREQDRGVLVEADERTVGAPVLLVDTVADRGVLAIVASGHADAQELFCSRVVRDLEACFLLNHLVTWPFPRSQVRAIVSLSRWGAFR